jgi:pyruvate-formate lyase-activating enzyme
MVPGMLDVKGTQILAKSLFKELRGSGYTPNQILSLSTELIDLVTQDLKAGHDEPHPATLAEKSGTWRAAL